MKSFTNTEIHRQTLLHDVGFLPFECEGRDDTDKGLCRVSWHIPYFRSLIKTRRRDFMEAMSHGMTWAEWEVKVLASYQDKGWVSDGKPDEWKMYRAWEDKYKLRVPEYESPWQKKPKRKDFSAMYQNTMARIDRMMGVNRGYSHA